MYFQEGDKAFIPTVNLPRNTLNTRSSGARVAEAHRVTRVRAIGYLQKLKPITTSQLGNTRTNLHPKSGAHTITSHQSLLAPVLLHAVCFSLN